jgi:glucose/arabinose dehydrogenase
VLLVRGLDQGNLETLNLETAGGATHAAWSADSGAVALWGDAGRVEVWTDLAGSARRALAADLGEITAVAVASEGRTVVVAQAGAILVADGSSVRRILELEKPVALALAGGRLFVADAARNEILVLANYAEAGDAQLFANAARGVDEVVALAVSPDQRTLVAASRSARSLTAFDAATGEISATVALDFEPMRLDRFSASLFALNNGGDSGPLQILDCARSLAVYFVPAEPASVMED